MKKVNELSLVEQMELEIKKQEKAQKKEKINKLAKPNLLSRIWSGLLDVVFVFIITLIVEFAFVNLFYEPIGYNSLVNEIHQMYDASSLYHIDEKGNYIEIEDYKEMDQIIIDYYSNNEYPLSKKMLDQYNNDKQSSTYFIFKDNIYLEKEDASDEKLKEFYEREYQDAINCFNSNPEYIMKVNKIESIIAVSIIFSIIISTSIIYLIVPLIRKEGETPSQIIHKLCLIDIRDLSTIKKSQIVIRYFIILFFNYLFTVVLFIKNDYFVPLTIILSVAMICITKNNIGPHDYVSQSMVILKRRADAFDTLKNITNKK
jgi:hypothetical protein